MERIKTKKQLKKQVIEKVQHGGFQDGSMKTSVKTKDLPNAEINDIKHDGQHGQGYKKK